MTKHDGRGDPSTGRAFRAFPTSEEDAKGQSEQHMVRGVSAHRQGDEAVADKERQLEMLRQGTDVWNEWRLDNQDIAVDLADATLAGAVLFHANLTKAN